MKIAACTVAAALALLSAPVGGTTLDGWTSDFHAATNAAATTHTPLVLLWANEGCKHCANLESDVQKAEFTAWREGSGYLFCFVLATSGKDPKGAEGARKFAQYAAGTKKSYPASYPYVCLYWPQTSGVKATSFTTEKASVVMANADSFFSGYVPRPDYTGGDLEFSADYPCARVEAEAGVTAFVEVPLTRADSAANWPGTNTVVALYGNGELMHEQIEWEAGEARRPVSVPIPEKAAAGEAIDVALYADSQELRGETAIYIVETENSPRNPLFVGEKTANDLQYGEWTMDLDVALAKRAANADAHLLALVGGSLWCPDCVMTDLYLFDTDDFKNWAVANKVILVDIDIPNLPNTATSPSLLTRIVARASDNYVTARGTQEADETMRWQSGAGYLSRHSVSDAAAAAVAARNAELVGTHWGDDGWNDPERPNQSRTGVPVLFALNADGAPTGCLDTFSSDAPTEYKDVWLNRLDELLDTAVEGRNLADTSWRTTSKTYGGTDDAVGTLCAVELAAAHRLVVKEKAAWQTVTVHGTADAQVTVSLLSVSGTTAKTVSTATGSLVDGVTVEGVVASSGTYYLTIRAEASGVLAIDSDAADTTVDYTLSGDRTELANPFQNEYTTKAFTTVLPLFLENGDEPAELAMTLKLTQKKTGALTAVLNNGKKNLVSMSGKWKQDKIAADGTISISLAKNGYRIGLTLRADGFIVATATDAAATYTSGECGIADTYADFAGYYTVALPPEDVEDATLEPFGVSFLTVKAGVNNTMKKNGQVNYTAYLSNGSMLSGVSNMTLLDANFGVVPILKELSGRRLALALKIRRGAAKAPSPRAVLAMDGVQAIWADQTSPFAYERRCDAFGSIYDKSASLLDYSGVAALEFVSDVEFVADSQKFGALKAVAADGMSIAVAKTKITKADKTSGASLSFNRTTGILSGTTKLSFTGKSTLSATYKGALLPGWFDDCACGEDDDTLIPRDESHPFGLGYCLFSDTVNKRSAKRSFPVGMDSTTK